MIILYLVGNNPSVRVSEYIQALGDVVLKISKPIDQEFVSKIHPDWIVSFGYRHIIKPDVLEYFPGRAINLHASYLPWNRGCDPNFWSWTDETPHGVTIHLLDEGIDTGPIIKQYQIFYNLDFMGPLTLRTTYNQLIEVIENLFISTWWKIRAGQMIGKKQEGQGSYHRKGEIEKYRACLTKGWDTEINALLYCVTEVQVSEAFWDRYDKELKELEER